MLYYSYSSLTRVGVDCTSSAKIFHKQVWVGQNSLQANTHNSAKWKFEGKCKDDCWRFCFATSYISLADWAKGKVQERGQAESVRERPDWANQMSLTVVCYVLMIGSVQDGLVAILRIRVLVGVGRG